MSPSEEVVTRAIKSYKPGGQNREQTTGANVNTISKKSSFSPPFTIDSKQVVQTFIPNNTRQFIAFLISINAVKVSS